MQTMNNHIKRVSITRLFMGYYYFYQNSRKHIFCNIHQPFGNFLFGFSYVFFAKILLFFKYTKKTAIII